MCIYSFNKKKNLPPHPRKKKNIKNNQKQKNGVNKSSSFQKKEVTPFLKTELLSWMS